MLINNNLDKFVKKVLKDNNNGVVLDNGFVKSGLINGNSLKLLPLIPSNSIDHVDIDVPYLLKSEKTKLQRKTRKQNKSKHSDWMEKSFLKLAEMSDGFPIHFVLSQLMRVEKHLNMAIWCSNNQIYPIEHFFHSLHLKGLRIQMIQWNKTNPAAIHKYGFDYHDCEHCLIIFQTGNDSIHGNYYTKRHDYSTPTNNDSKKFGYKHPTVKPLFINRNIVYSMTRPNDTVLDIYMGSGTSGVASRILNRNYIGIEIEKNYYNLAVKRISESNHQAQKVIDYEISRIEDKTYYDKAVKADKSIKASLYDPSVLALLFHHVKVAQDIQKHTDKHVKVQRHTRAHRHHFNSKKEYYDFHNHTYYHRYMVHMNYVKKQKNNPRSKYYQYQEQTV